MGLSGGGSSKSGSAQKWAQPYAKQAAGQVQDVFSQNQPQLQQITQGVTSLLPGISDNYQSWNPVADQSQSYLSDAIGGKFLSPESNPYLEGMIDKTGRDVTDRVNAQFSQAGRYGSGAHGYGLTQGLADAENQLLYQNYGAERGMQNQAATTAPDIQNQNLSQLLAASGAGAELPYTGTNSMANSLAALFGGGTQKGPSFGSQLLSAGAQVGAAAIKASDRRLKTNIEQVGAFDDGLGIYRWNYIWDADTRHEGVMADDVAELRPWALGPEIAGYATVDYGAL
jgi:hypothetical protein